MEPPYQTDLIPSGCPHFTSECGPHGTGGRFIHQGRLPPMENLTVPPPVHWLTKTASQVSGATLSLMLLPELAFLARKFHPLDQGRPPCLA